jgi:Putative prokaryotic signal transducing protein
VHTPPPEPPDAFDPSLDLVVVLETNNRIQLAMARGLLEDAGIPFFLLGQIATLIQDVDPFLHKWVKVQVPQDREAEARELLETVVQPEAD